MISSDQGPQFESSLWRELAERVGTKLIRTTAYHHQANGLIERFQRTLKNVLRAAENLLWAKPLLLVLLGIRSGYKDDLSASSVEMVYGTGVPSFPVFFFF